MNNREAVEKFHLVFLRHFAATVSPGTVCLKGGVNLRLYHNSARLSEDMDFDARKVGVEILKKNVSKVLAAKPLLTELAAAGIALSEIKPSKQTPTVQRWKFHIIYQETPIATRTQVQARDVFDLNHLSSFAEAVRGVPSWLAARAVEQLGLITFEMFREQVVPYLPNDLAEHYGTPEAWKTMVDRVGNDLSRA
jgi:hypothetical protein